MAKRGPIPKSRDFDPQALRACRSCQKQAPLSAFRVSRGLPGNVCRACDSMRASKHKPYRLMTLDERARAQVCKNAWKKVNEPYRIKERERSTAKRFANPEYARQWAKSPRGHWYRAANSADGSVTRELIRELQDEKHCAYCCCELSADNRHIDHVTALANGGAHTAGNLVASCDECNLSKADRWLLPWLLARTEKISRVPVFDSQRVRARRQDSASSSTP